MFNILKLLAINLTILVTAGFASADESQQNCGDLFDAIDAENIACVQKLINAGADVNEIREFEEKNADGKDAWAGQMTPLHRAIYSNSTPNITQLLIKAGADVHLQRSDKETPLHIAARWNHNPDFISIFIDSKVNVNATNHFEWTPLHSAVIYKNFEAVSILIKNDANVNSKEIWNQTPLHYAASIDNPTFVSILLENGADADIHAKDIHGETPLHKSAGNKNLTILYILLENGADVNAGKNEGKTPLHSAAFYHEITNPDFVSAVIQNGADINEKDNHGRTPLHYAIDSQTANPDFISLLIKNGADVNAKDNNGNTPLSYAKDRVLESFEPGVGEEEKETREKIVQILIDAGAEANYAVDIPFFGKIYL